MLAQKASLGGQNQPPPLVPKKVYLKFVLKLPDGAGDRRLGDMQEFCRAGHALKLTDGKELL